MRHILHWIYAIVSFCVCTWYVEEIKGVTIYNGFSGGENRLYVMSLVYISMVPIIIIELIIEYRKKSKEKSKKKKK